MLRVINLRVGIDSKEIVKGVSLAVRPGEVHAVMGPNGSGKSTLAYALAGHPSYKVRNNKQQTRNKQATKNKLQKPTVSIDGRDLLAMSPDERARAGTFLAFQYPVEVPGVRVSNFLRRAYEARFERDKSRKFKSVLEFLRMLEKKADVLGVNKELIRRGLNEGFSGGEKKRLEILQMAVLEPKYAVLDETDSGLDIDAIKAVSKGVRKIVKEYKTGVVVITHYQRILKYLKPDFVHVMVEGKVVESGGSEVAKRLEKEGYKEWA